MKAEKGHNLFLRASLGPLQFQDPMLLCAALLLLFRLDAGGWLRLSLLASVIHESGHILVFAFLLRRLPKIDVTMTGFCLHTAGLLLPSGQELVIAAAGPAANLAAAAFLWLRMQPGGGTTIMRLGLLWANLLVCGFNLLPIPPLDGWKVVSLSAYLVQSKLHFSAK